MLDVQQTKLSYPDNVLELAARDPQLRALMPLALWSSGARPVKPTVQESLEAVTRVYAERPALAYRDYEIGPDQKAGRNSRILRAQFRTISYRELNGRVKRLATVWREHPVHRVDPGDFVCILGFASIDYTVIDFACAYAQAVSVPLQTTLGGDLTGVFTNTAPSCVAATVDDLLVAAEMAVAHPSIRSVIAFDYHAGADSDQAQLEAAAAVLARGGANAQLVTLEALLASCTADAWQALPPAPEGAERTALLVHSSGSSGQPKGAIIPDWSAARVFSIRFPKIPVISVMMAPMNHMMGRFTLLAVLARGGTAYFTAKSDLSELFEDIRLAQPTELAMFPRVMEVIHRHFTLEVIRRSDGNAAMEEIRAEVMAEMRAGFLGDRVCAIQSGGAPPTPEVIEFIQNCFEVRLDNNYGSTEAGRILCNGRIIRESVIDYKLRDVPELGYSASDRPYPRGELCVRTVNAVMGYYKQPEATAKLYDEDGYLRTGDIMEERAPDQLAYLERTNDVLKLSQGEFIAIGALGRIFENHSPAIMQMYAYGNSAHAYLVAVLVPDMGVVEERLGSQPDEAALRAFLRQEMRAVAAKANLRTFEIPRDFIIEYEPFSFENGLLTSMRKRRRPALKSRYGEQLEALYAAQDRRQEEELRALSRDSSLSVREKLIKALEASLGVEAGGVDVSQSFSGLGGDSLGATGFAMLLNEIFNVEVSVNTILSPAGNVLSWTRAIERARQGPKGGVPDYTQVHGKGKSRLHARDLDISAFFDVEMLDNFPLEPPKGPTRCVLLTGATGYLGRFLCLEWLERLEARDGKMICLIRAADEATALQRLAASFASDSVLAKRFEALAKKHLEIRIGDVADPNLGLEPAVFDRLAQEVDHIVHCGALVNHLLPYAELFGPNVIGTAQLARLALTHRQKYFDFISSVAVCGLLEPDQGTAESVPMLQEVALKNAHAEGYSYSKWAGEHLLLSANARFGLPVNIFRCGMILTNRRYAGQLNLPDSFTRLIYSIVVTGSAPASFYKRAPDGACQPAHYEGLPADFVAAAIAGIGDAPSPGTVRAFHVTNPHADAHVSMDSFVDWIEAAGYRIEREDDHARWVQHFEAKLRALPEEKRQRSVLPVFDYVRSQIKPSRSIDNVDFVEAVSRLPVRVVPQLDRALLQKYLNDLQLLKLVTVPE